jgi:hypothetical protein
MDTGRRFPGESREIQVALAPIQCLYGEAADLRTKQIKNLEDTTGGLAFNTTHLVGPQAGNPRRVKTEFLAYWSNCRRRKPKRREKV